MTTQDIALHITQELSQTLSQLDLHQLSQLEDSIRQAGKIYIAGAGRSLLMARTLAMRLMHMGRSSYVVGETSTPAAQAGDLLIIASGSGKTGALVAYAQKAKSLGMTLALITAHPFSTLGNLADCLLEIPTPAQDTIQLGGNLFEQCLLIVCDALVIRLLDGMALEAANHQLRLMHANLE
jgi:6-phospho-3-hexuloisomerase